MTQFKNYYKILNVPQDASLFEIEQAYKIASLNCPPQRHKLNRYETDKRLNQVNEAFKVLSDNEARLHYDEILHKGYGLDEANKTFEKFFNENDFVSEEQSKFFEKNFPQRPKSSYQILGVSRNATEDQIKNAYRKLAIQYHPKNNQNLKQSQQKFIEINKAYEDICCNRKRQIYDSWLFGQFVPIKTQSPFQDFQDFNKIREFQIPREDQFFKPLHKSKWGFGMLDDNDEFGNFKSEESLRQSKTYSTQNGVDTKKVIKTKKQVVNGKLQQIKTEDYLLPTGERQIIRTIESEGQKSVKKYTFRKGEQPPKQLLN